MPQVVKPRALRQAVGRAGIVRIDAPVFKAARRAVRAEVERNSPMTCIDT